MGSGSTLSAGSAGSDVFSTKNDITKKVRHKLIELPYLTVFDNLAYRVDGDTVTLAGEVTQPFLKSDAERAVKHIEGVARVDNQIKVLPLSPFDNQIRRAEYRAIFGYAGLYRYAVEEELLDHSPAAHVRRPRLDYDSHATALDRNELGALLVAAGLGTAQEHALISLLALNGLRISEALALGAGARTRLHRV